MKRLLLFALLGFTLTDISAQQQSGKVVYERTVQMQINFPGMDQQMQSMIPRQRTDKFELIFSSNQSLWKAGEPDNREDGFAGGGGDGGGMQIRMVAAGSNDVLYTNFDTKKKVEQRELFDKNFIVDDSIHALKWKMTGEAKDILGHNCMKATASQVRQSMNMSMINGKMERTEVSDTSVIIAWVAADIPVAAGPAEYQGQLPGLILEMDISNGRQVYKAVSISDKADIAAIKEPSGKKRYTPEQFTKERNRIMDDMQRNNMGGPQIRTRIN